MYLTIEDLSEKTQIKIPTIRYYERSAIITPDKGTADVKARYTETDVLRLDFLRFGRDVGLVLAEIRAVLEMISVGSCEELETFAAFIDERASSLTLLSGRVRDVSKAIRQGGLNEAQAIGSLAQLRRHKTVTQDKPSKSSKGVSKSGQ